MERQQLLRPTSIYLVPVASFRAKRSLANLTATFHRMTRRPCDSGHRIVTFHSIDTPVDGDVHRIYDMSRRSFSNHVQALRRMSEQEAGVKVVSVGDLVDRTVAITFDDGYASTLTIAASELTRHSMPFTVFVTPMLIDSSDRRYLSRKQLIELADLPGVAIGAHGYQHVPFSSLLPKDRSESLIASRRWLEDLLQREVTSMSYPFGDTPLGIADEARNAGFTSAACSIWGFNDESTDRMMLRRLDLWDGDSRQVVAAKIEGHWNRLMDRRKQ